ncbi:MAG: flagellar biosynthetic protein FliO [Syntrophorhabdaceae bacterium]|nr:flagellar biosynthetic protein FliO [Syntrophorhabdaceae bacterium]
MGTLLEILKVLFVLVGLVVGIVFLYRLTEKLRLKYQLGRTPGGYTIKKVGSMYIGYKKQIAIVEIEEHIFVLAIGEKEITPLANWKKEERPL